MDHTDHRVLGREMDLFDTVPVVGSGLPLWLPDGAVIRRELERLGDVVARRTGCRDVYTPVLAKRELFESSGHWDKFRDEMFAPMHVGGEELVLRPANCPHHAQVYAARPHSYRDLPVRLHELAPMFRSELSGVLGGLSRVRQINLDDTHVFCRPDQVRDEVCAGLEAIRWVYDLLGLEIREWRLSVRGPQGAYLGDDALWWRAEEALAGALHDVGVEYRRAEDEAAFYGPKVDVQVVDPQGREETLSTIQLDFSQPESFGLSYAAADGSQQRPVMIHRGLLSAMERMVAFLVERFDGRMPPWLAPCHVVVLPVASEHDPAANELADRLDRADLRVEVQRDGSLGRRLRAARLRRSPWICVIGAREADAGAVQVHVPAEGARRVLEAGDFVARAVEDVGRRALAPSLP